MKKPYLFLLILISLILFQIKAFSTTLAPPDTIYMGNEINGDSIFSCDAIIYDDGGEGWYTKDVNTTITIFPDSEERKTALYFYYLGMISSELKVYDGTSKDEQLIGTYTGTRTPEMIYSTNSDGALTLNFNSVNRYPGFKIELSCPSKEDAPLDTALLVPSSYLQDYQFHTCNGLVMDNGGTGGYEAYSSDKLHIYPDEYGKDVSLEFLDFNLGSSDQLKIYEGYYWDLVGTFSGQNSPGTINSTNSLIILEFNNDYTYRQGFWAKVSCPTITSHSDHKDNKSLQIGPNPTQDYVNLDDVYLYELLDLRGNRLEEGRGERIDLSAYQQGTYLLKVENRVYRILKN